jgi:hypothetical protein
MPKGPARQRLHAASMARSTDHPSVSDIDVTQQIRIVRRQRVLLDSDLAALYGVPTHRFNEAVRRNAARFPEDFAFRLTAEEHMSLRSQIAILKTGRGQHRKYLPYVFTEHGSIMAAMILNSPTAIEMSVHVVRAFVKLRQILASNTDLARRLESLERSVAALDSNTRREFVRVYKAILKLMGPPPQRQ